MVDNNVSGACGGRGRNDSPTTLTHTFRLLPIELLIRVVVGVVFVFVDDGTRERE